MSIFGVILVRIFPPFGLNTERYEVYLRIQSEYRKIRTRITPNTNTNFIDCLKKTKSRKFTTCRNKFEIQIISGKSKIWEFENFEKSKGVCYHKTIHFFPLKQERKKWS